MWAGRLRQGGANEGLPGFSSGFSTVPAPRVEESLSQRQRLGAEPAAARARLMPSPLCRYGGGIRDEDNGDRGV